MAILSNSVGSKEDTGYKEAMLLEEKIGVPVIRHEKKKPEVEEDIKRHFPGIKEASDVCLVGDRVMADTVMSNALGYFTIEVEPFCTKPENFMVKLMRKVEKHVIP